MSGEQDVIKEVDISERLRLLMRHHRLTIQQLADIAGVSKSAIEKYLAGPSSPRATALASICVALDVNAHWLLFGEPDDDLVIISRAVEGVVVALLNELKQDTAIANDFSTKAFGTQEWRLFTWDTAYTRGQEAVSIILDKRSKALAMARDGLRPARLDPMPLDGSAKTKGER